MFLFHLRRMWFGTERVVCLSLRSIHKVSISSPSTLLVREKKNYLSFQQKALTPSVSLWHSPQLPPSASLCLWEDKHQAFQHSLAASNEYFQRRKRERCFVSLCGCVSAVHTATHAIIWLHSSMKSKKKQKQFYNEISGVVNVVRWLFELFAPDYETDFAGKHWKRNKCENI